MVRWGTCLALLVIFAPALLAQAPQGGERYALLVAVREYPKAKLGSLRFVENDIEELASALIAAGYKAENVVRLSFAVGGQAGKARYLPNGENIRQELRILLGALGKEDSVLVAFAGHGVQFKGKKEAYFCPSDADLEQTQSMLAIGDVYSQLKASAARVKVLLVDACRNDPALASSRGPKGVELEAVGKPQEVEPPQGIAALFSCSAGQKAWEDTEFRHGVFFHFVIAGLKGAADFNGDGQVSYNELSAYSIAEVKRHARVKLGELQVPQQKGEVEGDITLARATKPIPASPSATVRPMTSSPIPATGPAILRLEMKLSDGTPVNLSTYAGKVLLIVVVASESGNTPQYVALQSLYEKHRRQGFEILAFPCNQFGGQEPGTDKEIFDWVSRTYKVTFPLFTKIDVNGAGQSELFKHLTDRATNPSSPGPIKWNFEKFLLARDGRVFARFPAETKPDDPKVLAAIEAALATKP